MPELFAGEGLQCSPNLPTGRNASINHKHNSPETDSIVGGDTWLLSFLHIDSSVPVLDLRTISVPPTRFCLSPSMVVQCGSHPLLQTRAPCIPTGTRPAFTSTSLPHRRQRLSLVKLLAQDKGRTCSKCIFGALTTCLQNILFLHVFGLPKF